MLNKNKTLLILFRILASFRTTDYIFILDFSNFIRWTFHMWSVNPLFRAQYIFESRKTFQSYFGIKHLCETRYWLIYGWKRWNGKLQTVVNQNRLDIKLHFWKVRRRHFIITSWTPNTYALWKQIHFGYPFYFKIVFCSLLFRLLL